MSSTPRTIRVGIDPSQPTASYSLAPGLVQYVESVYIEVDNTAGADTRPVVTLSEASGVVIAKKRQGESITGGTSGSATWALRLDDEGGASTATGFIKYDFNNTGDWLEIRTTGTGAHLGSSIHLDAFEDFRIDVGRDLDIDTVGNDFNLQVGNDWNVDLGNDFNPIATNDVNMQALHDLNIAGANTASMTCNGFQGRVDFRNSGDHSVEWRTGHNLLFYNNGITFGETPLLALNDQSHTDVVRIRLRTGKKFIVADDSDTPIFTLTG